MNDLIARAIMLGIQMYARHNNKPPGWKPTQEDVFNIINMVDAATPENEKAAAAARLGVKWPPEQ